MTVLLLVPLVAALVIASFPDVEKSRIIEGIKNLTLGKDDNKTKRLLDRIKEDFDNMPFLQKYLVESEEQLNTNMTLSEEQDKLLARLKSRTRKTNACRKNSIEGVNAKCGIVDALFQGDMVLSKDQQDEVIANVSGSRSKRQAHNDRTYPGMRWPNGVSYSLDGSLGPKAKAVFKKAAELWMNYTCIDFKEDLEEEGERSEDLLLVFKEHGCWAEVGRQGGWQLLSLGDEKCEKTGMAAHEIGHALGFWHTHARHDRNDFITVLRSNIQRDRRKNFVRQLRETNNNYNLAYDYGSVMHYGSRAFTKNTTRNPAIVPRDVYYTETLGSKIISFYDLLMMNMYYNCTDACKDEKTNCSNVGFLHPRDCSKCICPSGYGGQFCDERPPGCGEELYANETWQMLKGYLNGNDTESDGYSRCNYWIKAPIGKKIEIKIVRVPDSSTFDGCPYAGVEIKTNADQRLTGYRFCSDTFVNTTLTSNSSLVPVITYSFNEGEEQGDGNPGNEGELEGHEVSDVDEENDEDDEDEEDDEDDENEEYGEYDYEYEFGDVVILQYRYV